MTTRFQGPTLFSRMAWWLRQHTTVRLGWIAEQLGMGHASRVSQAVARVRQLQKVFKRVEAEEANHE